MHSLIQSVRNLWAWVTADVHYDAACRYAIERGYAVDSTDSDRSI